ncbi:hypothetical protein NGRA_1738 [Nosema granulosis]|uniref:Uncharacterized protein n=1 Tax=Nosema granulosis TaxID=83296 RepID=A0A9P6KYT8_9MICR|nr:hypothetical protein NGRA_1738 [Nosema granulosis]
MGQSIQNTKKNSHIRWRYQDRNCKDFLVVADNSKVVESKDHSHPLVEIKIENMKFTDNLRMRTKETSESAFNNIISAKKTNNNKYAIDTLLTLKSMNDRLQRDRNK